MAEPTQGELYSLLGEVTADSYRNKAEEERKLRRQLRRDQYKAMLLQPLVGAIATTGLETLGNVASNLVLGDKAKSFLNTEAGRSALAKSKENALFAKKIDDEHTIYSAPNAITTWESQIADDLILKSGTNDESDKNIIKMSVAHNREENEKDLKDHVEALEKQKLLLATLPTEKQIRDRAVAKDPDNYFARSKISKLLAKGGSYLGGKSIDELMERSTNWILTGSPDSEYAESISKTFKTGKGRQVFVDLIEASLEGDDNAIDTAVLALQGSPFYTAVTAKTGQGAENTVRFNKFQTTLHSSLTQAKELGITDTVYHRLVAHPEYEEILQKRDPGAFENLFNTIIFGSSEDVKNLSSSFVSDIDFFRVVDDKLETDDPKTRKEYLDLIVKDEVSFLTNVLARDVKDEDFNLGFYTPAVIKKGLRSHLSTQITNGTITIDKKSGTVFIDNLPESDRIEQLKYHIKEAHIASTKDPAIKAGVSVFFNSIKEQFDKIKNNEELSSRGRREAATTGLENSRKVLDEALKIHKNVFENDLYKDALRGAEDLMDSMFGDPQNIVTGRLIPEGINSTVREWRLDNQLYLAKEENKQKQPVAEEIIVSTEEEIQAAQDSLLSNPNEKISIDSVFKTAFENQPLNSTTVKLFTDNPDGMTLPDVESPASFTVAARNKESSNHDAHGITQVKVSTAIQPGYKTPNIFKVADSLGVPYDEKLAQEAIAITAKGAASQDKMTTEEGPAWQQVVDLLRNPEVNVRLGALYFNNLLEHYDNDPVRAIISYNAGPVTGNSFTGDRSELLKQTQDYLSKMGL